MFLLDFSKPINILELPQEKEWQKNIISFLKDWYNNSETIVTQTSGSTGIPKDIVLTKSAMTESASLTGKYLNLSSGDTALLCMPSLYIAGKMMLVRSIVWNLKLYCIEPSSYPLKNTDKKFTFSAMTPMQVEKSLEKIENIDKLIVGGAQIPSSLLSKLKFLNTDVYESFGMTETISHIALKKVSGNSPCTSFQLLPNTKIRVDRRGCLCIQPSFLSEEIITNDLVSLVSDREFEWQGRIDNIINSGGIKIFPEKVEKQLKSIINREFIISSREDAVLGKKVILIVEGDVIPELKEIVSQFTFDSKYEKPKEIIYVNQFERTKTGKIIRNKIF
ncbi:AMP-binding protein [Apibacter sp. HY039]|uniref:AMP-binding protein n=1 Tax=Apibacter sp. HY039 TaxID=2501476 RepID=UPI000FEC09C2|nr:AMP-binding protein [Apibacter sp. HY039]